MKLLVVGKRASITHWLEDCAAAWSAEGHEVRVESARDPRLHASIEAALLARRLGAPLAAAIARRAKRFSPDLILAIGAYHAPAVVLEHLAAVPGRAPIVGWVGDLFSPDAASAATLLDAVAYTDSGLMSLHEAFGFSAPARFLPHAVNPHSTQRRAPAAERQNRLVFVANPTDRRRDVVARITSPISLYGLGWDPFPGRDHRITARRVAANDLRILYGRHLAALNIRNEHNVLAGLNQRSFAPYLTGTPVVSDDQEDLRLCFEEGREVLVWRDVAELNEIHARLRREPALAARIGERGRVRLLSEHTYAHRLAALLGEI